jgi:hypothetical protein
MECGGVLFRSVRAYYRHSCQAENLWIFVAADAPAKIHGATAKKSCLISRGYASHRVSGHALPLGWCRLSKRNVVIEVQVLRRIALGALASFSWCKTIKDFGLMPSERVWMGKKTWIGRL